jgi:hypothetical protein
MEAAVYGEAGSYKASVLTDFSPIVRPNALTEVTIIRYWLDKT